MQNVAATYMSGDTVQLGECESVGRVMLMIAKLNDVYANDVQVLQNGIVITEKLEYEGELRLLPRQRRPRISFTENVLPADVTIVILKPEAGSITPEHLFKALLLHAKYEDVATCHAIL
eukprot:GEMP01055780.1.p2 GENE.GEMP01055780.1~~GEMP01055780.1.p2  ORF type:complete len:119 (+),score=13.00 GEMP01055780.1:75-431(+)